MRTVLFVLLTIVSAYGLLSDQRAPNQRGWDPGVWPRKTKAVFALWFTLVALLLFTGNYSTWDSTTLLVWVGVVLFFGIGLLWEFLVRRPNEARYELTNDVYERLQAVESEIKMWRKRLPPDIDNPRRSLSFSHWGEGPLGKSLEAQDNLLGCLGVVEREIGALQREILRYPIGLLAGLQFVTVGRK